MGASARRFAETELALEFDEFYRDNRDRIYRALAVTLRNAPLAAESVDEAMTRALERWDQVGGYDNPSGWVFRVGLNWARQRFRRLGRELPGTYIDGPVEDRLPEPEVGRALGRLPHHQRAVVVARYYLDWSTDETAAALRVPAGTVKSRLSRALASLEKELA